MVSKYSPRLKVVAEDKIILNGQVVSYSVKRSARARRVRLEMKRGTALTVILPRTYSLEHVTDIVKSKQRWILNTMTRFENHPLFSEKNIVSGDVIAYLGKQLRVVAKKGKETIPVYLERNRLVVNSASGNGELRSMLQTWYKTQATNLIQEKADKWSAKLGVTHNRITIRGQKSRWGSCSRNGNLSYNWKLVMAPETVIDYVVIHELAHLKQMNHSKKFWQLVAAYCPEWRDCKKWLRNHESELANGLFARQMKLEL
jgi:predicted metal-dependent hydrolase